MSNFYFKITDEVLPLGIKAFGVRIKDVKIVQHNDELEAHKNQELAKIKTVWIGKNLEEDVVLKGFRDLHKKVGRSNRKYIASPEALISFLLEKDRLPKINTLVDIYNLISCQSRLAFGAHDVSKITGGVTLKLNNGIEYFTPLEKNESEIIQSGEYGYVDENNQIICRLEVLQCDSTRITTNTNDVFMLAQGNSNVDSDHVKSSLRQACELIQKFCGGSLEYLNE